MSFEDLLARKPYRWPRKDDRPFNQPKGLETAGPLVTDELTRTVSIMNGFMLAGEALADLTLSEPLQRYDLVYPMLFCYRHAIEAGLKWIIAQYGPVVGNKSVDINNTHHLWKLWKCCVEIYLAHGEKEGKEELMSVEKSIKQFHDWDKGGMAFRYATDNRGAMVNFQHGNIDIANLKDVMQGIANFFRGADGWLSNAALRLG